MLNNISDLIGKTLIKVDGAVPDSDHILFETQCGRKYHMYHDQDCCEVVDIEQIDGDIESLLNTPILEAYESTDSGYNYDSFTWTFYRFITVKGTVVIRWYGSSNGYYSESVSFAELKKQ